MGSFVLGYNAKLYRNTGTYASPTWSEMTNVKDLTLNMDLDEADVTTRASGGWKANVATLLDGSIEFEMVYDPTDANFTAVQTAFFSRSAVEFAAMDGPIATAGSQGLRATCMVKQFSVEEKLAEALTVKVTIKPTYAANPPSWYTVSS
jgi:hypothetical protein